PFTGEIKDRGLGGNLQNIEKGQREIYVSDGWSNELTAKCQYYLQSNDLSIFTDEEKENLRIFIQTDCAGAEALIVAYLCYNGDYRQLFINGIKPHSFLGMHLFKDVWAKEMLSAGLIGPDSGFNIMELIECPI